MTGTSGGILPRVALDHGASTLQSNLDLQPTASGTWHDTDLEVNLPGPGVYQLDGLIRSLLSASTAPINAYIGVRLFDVTLGVSVPDSEVIVHQIMSTSSNNNETSPITAEYETAAAATIRLQAVRYNNQGSANVARIVSGGVGYTMLRYLRVVES